MKPLPTLILLGSLAAIPLNKLNAQKLKPVKDSLTHEIARNIFEVRINEQYFNFEKSMTRDSLKGDTTNFRFTHGRIYRPELLADKKTIKNRTSGNNPIIFKRSIVRGNGPLAWAKRIFNKEVDYFLHPNDFKGTYGVLWQSEIDAK